MRMRLLRPLVRLLVVAAVCLAGAAVVPGSPAFASRKTWHVIFFTEQEMWVNCLLSGGSFFSSGGIYGCHMADGGEVWCNNGNCFWLPPDPQDDRLGGILATINVETIAAVNPYPGDVVNHHQQVLALTLQPSATLTVEQTWAAAGGGAPVDTVRVVTTTSKADLTATELDPLAGGTSVKGSTVVGSVKPDPKLSLAAAAAGLKVTAQRVYVIRGDADPKAAVLTILVTG